MIGNRRLKDLIDDPICSLLMRSDGVNPQDVIRLMMAVKPMIAVERSSPPAPLNSRRQSFRFGSLCPSRRGEGPSRRARGAMPA